MRYYGIFHVMDPSNDDPSVIVVADDSGTVMSYRGEDWYLILQRAVESADTIANVTQAYPAQFRFEEIDSPWDISVDAYVDDWSNHPGLRHLVNGLARQDALLDGGRNWVAFLADDAEIEAEVKPGMDLPVLRIDALLLSTEHRMATENDVRAWIDRQPIPELGALSVGRRGEEGSTAEHLPVLSLDVQLDSILAEFIRDLLHPYAEAWDNQGVASVSTEHTWGGGEGGGFYRYQPTRLAPRNAWLLMGSEASYPTVEELQKDLMLGRAGIYDNEWTAPKNGELGDLALIYFIAPRKAACFVARLASRPYWRTDVEVNAVKKVERHQWWAAMTPFIEVEPIPYESLQEAAGGYLPLRGRSGHYLSPEVIKALRFTAKDPRQQEELDRVAQVPTGDPDLAGQAEGLEGWKAIPGGALPLEAKVSEHIVEPLAQLLFGPDFQWAHEGVIEPTLGPILVREHRVPSGVVDFVFEYAGQFALAVEVKLTLLRPSSGVWMESPDFLQLRRYMSDLDLPGMLIDAQRILLVNLGADAPFLEIIRAEATWEDIALIRDLVLERHRVGSATTIPPSGMSTPPRSRATRRAARRG